MPWKVAVCAGAVAFGVVAGFAYYATPKSLVAGYQPEQPIPFSHKIHVDQVGLDCRYCHSHVEVSAHSNIPGANTCWNCHQHVQRESPKLQPLRDRFDPAHPDFGKPIRWVRVHKAPDYVYFDHSAHVNRGISCRSCHGPVDQMDVVYQAENHSMGWCLECHRAPHKHLRPLEEVYNMNYDVTKYLEQNPLTGADGRRLETQDDLGRLLEERWRITPRDSCASCHH